MNQRVLIVDDSIYMRALIRVALESEGYEVVGEAEDGKTTIELAFDLKPDIITLDNILPDMTGMDIVDKFIEMKLHFKILMISAMGQNKFRAEAKSKGVAQYLVKPFESTELINLMKSM